jgi:hypothetical protein
MHFFSGFARRGQRNIGFLPKGPSLFEKHRYFPQGANNGRRGQTFLGCPLSETQTSKVSDECTGSADRRPERVTRVPATWLCLAGIPARRDLFTAYRFRTGTFRPYRFSKSVPTCGRPHYRDFRGVVRRYFWTGVYVNCSSWRSSLLPSCWRRNGSYNPVRDDSM